MLVGRFILSELICYINVFSKNIVTFPGWMVKNVS